MRRRSAKVAFALATGMALAATGAAQAADPLRKDESFDLGIFGQKAPEILRKAKADPYAPPAEPACQSVPQEIEQLNAALGPDADQEQKKTNHVTKLVGGAIRGLIPHRDVIRLLTGAGKKDDAAKQAALAGWARRGYLKGLAKTLDCTQAQQIVAEGSVPPLEIPPLEPQQTASSEQRPALTPTATVGTPVDAAAIEAPPVNP
jgi:hypothetical protein